MARILDIEVELPVATIGGKIKSISVNGVEQPIVDKNVNIAVPTKTSDLNNDSNFVKNEELAQVAKSGDYNDLENTPYIPSTYKQGIVSQTQTWTQAADGSYSYVMTNPVTGNIPISFIDKWNILGSKYASSAYSHTFNETTGYFELNGLTDISYEEAIVIVEESQPFSMTGVVTKYARTNFAVQSSSVTITRFAQYSNIEVAYLAGASLNGTNANTNFFDSKYLHTILSMRSQYLVTSYTFANCPSLVTIDCYGSGSSAYSFKCNVIISGNNVLSIESLATMVRQRNGTDAFTITVAPAVYTRCQADTTEYTYSGNTYVGIIAYANARNITIQSA